MSLILLEHEDDREIAALSRAWVEIENTKREWRGIPKLAVSSLREILEYKRKALKSANATPSEPNDMVELSTALAREKESVNSETVPTPDPGMPPDAGTE